MQIYDTEIQDGLGDALANHSLAYTLDISKATPEVETNVAKWIATAGLTQPDLFYMDSILVTLGWNLNDDIFLKEEVFPARNTPVDKPFNKMHNQEDIIGHMTSSRLLNSDFKIVDGTDFEHIAVSSVIYTAWRDDKKKEEINTLISQIMDGKWKVSMECLFDKFDYGIITPEGKQMVIARTPETSHLTKHLRAYKGTGTYQGNRIGRVLRNITYCGKGLVDQPGNPYSVIFNANKKFFGASASLKELRMNEKELELAQAALATAKAELESVRAEVQKVAEAKLQAAIAERDEVIKTKDVAIASLQADLAKASESVAKVTASLEVAEAAKIEALTGFEAAKAELDKIKSEAVLAARKTALAGVVAAERVESLLGKFAKASDEQFAELISTLSEFKPFEKKDDKKEDKEKEDAEAAKECKEKTTANLKEAEVDADIPMTSTAAKTDDQMTAVAAYLNEQFSKNVNLKGSK
jgi:hypothetical protein